MRRATYDDVLNAPESKVAEILDGELFLSPRPAPRHSLAASELGAFFLNRRAEPFDAIELALAPLWGEETPPTSP